MAAANAFSGAMNRRREKITELPLYHSGELWKKFTGEKNFKKYFAELRGRTIFFYTEGTSEMYTEKLELENLKTMKMDVLTPSSGMFVYTLNLRNEAIQLKANGPDSGEEWQGYILTVAMMEVPGNLCLLPGQIVRLEMVLNSELERASCLPSSQSSAPAAHSNITADTPSCFYDVTRKEAQQMLEDKPECGSLIIRPSKDGNGYAVTLRQAFLRGPEFRHYKVQSTDCGFIIELDVPVTVPTLDEVVLHFIKETEYTVQPFVKSRMYDTQIGVSKMALGVPPKPPIPVSYVSPTVKPLLSKPNAQADRKKVMNIYELPFDKKKR